MTIQDLIQKWEGQLCDIEDGKIKLSHNPTGEIMVFKRCLEELREVEKELEQNIPKEQEFCVEDLKRVVDRMNTSAPPTS